MADSNRPTATEQAKMRANAMKPPQRPAAQTRRDMDQAAEMGNQEDLRGANPADLLQQTGSEPMYQQQQPQVERGQPRPREQVEADLNKFSKALQEVHDPKVVRTDGKEDKSEVTKQKEDEAWWSWQEQDVLANSRRRKQIEKGLRKMRVEDLLLHNEVKQVVTIIPPTDDSAGIEVEFRSVSVDEDLAIKRMMSSFRGSDQYISDRFAIMNLVCGLFRLNDNVLPSHLNFDGNFDENLYNDKLAVVRKWPYNLVQDLVNNWAWFEDRVRHLFVIEDLGNG